MNMHEYGYASTYYIHILYGYEYEYIHAYSYKALFEYSYSHVCQTKSTRVHGPGMRLQRRATDSGSHSAPVQEALCTPKPGTRTMSRTSKSSNTAERAQSSSKSRQIYGANPDPWA